MKNILFILIIVSTYCLGQAGRPTASNPVFPVTAGTANLKLYGNVNYKPFTLTGNVTITHNTTSNVSCVTKITATPQLGYKIIFPVAWNRVNYASFDTAKTNVIYINRNANGVVDYSIIGLEELNKNRSLSNYNTITSPVDSIVAKTYPSSMNFAGVDRTVVLWLKATNTTGGGQMNIISNGAQWRLYALSNQLNFFNKIGCAYYGPQPAFENWFFVILRLTAGGYVQMDYNNNIIFTGSFCPAAAITSLPTDRLIISGSSKSFKMENLAIFNKLLTNVEVTELYNGGRQLDYSISSVSSNILEYFTFDNTLISKQGLELEGRNGKKIIYSKDTPLK